MKKDTLKIKWLEIIDIKPIVVEIKKVEIKKTTKELEIKFIDMKILKK